MISFVDNESGNTFFECHPAEARLALEYVQELRQDPNEMPAPPHVKKRVAKALREFRRISDSEVVEGKGSNSFRLCDGFAAIERFYKRVGFVVTSAKTFAEIRKFDRELYTHQTQASVLRLGMMGNIWGAEMLVSRDIEDGVFYMMDEDFTVVRGVESEGLSDVGVLGVKKKIRELIKVLSKFMSEM